MGLAHALVALGEVALAQRDYPGAREAYEEPSRAIGLEHRVNAGQGAFTLRHEYRLCYAC